MKSSKQTPPDPLECSREHEFNDSSRASTHPPSQRVRHPPPTGGTTPRHSSTNRMWSTETSVWVHLHNNLHTCIREICKCKWNKAESKRLTTVWWLTWMTSSPAWIFLQRSASDWRRTERETESETLDTWHYDPRELRQAASYSFCCPGDHMQTVVCGFDVHALQDDKRNVN